MSYEYVKLSAPEIFFSKKNLLQSQIESLNVLKRFKEYQRLRREEFVLKVALKSKIDEAKNLLLLLNKLLPVTSLKEEYEKDDSFRKAKLSLEEEIEYIKRKLERLR